MISSHLRPEAALPSDHQDAVLVGRSRTGEVETYDLGGAEVRLVPAGMTLAVLVTIPYLATRPEGLSTTAIAIIVVGLLVAFGAHLLMHRTRLGMLIRAGASNRTMVAALGVNIKLLYTVVFGFGAALAGLAGLMAGPI